MILPAKHSHRPAHGVLWCLFALVISPCHSVLAEQVLLGDPALTGGIPGKGPLTLGEANRWLADPKNHRVIEPKLPPGLAAGSHNMAGLEHNPLTRAKIELGRQLYFDTRLSADNTVSCASCHSPTKGYAFDTKFSVGIDGQPGSRNSPAIYNRILSRHQFWDGRAASLEEQAVGPIKNPLEMGNASEECVATLKAIPAYARQFQIVFPDGVTMDNVCRAIASFERVIVTGPSPWDHYEALSRFQQAYAEDLEDPEYLREEEPELLAEYEQLKTQSLAHPLSPAAQRGATLFFSDTVGCTQCHVGANFSDEQYHNLGVGLDDQVLGSQDLGRHQVTKQHKDRGAFKTPTLRNVADTAPYMHDGSQETLADVVAWYVRGGRPNPQQSEKIKPLSLNTREEQDLVAFLKALSGPLPSVETGRLPE